MRKTVLAIDPGTKRCGMALVRRTESGALELLWRKIVDLEGLAEAIEEAETHEIPDLIIVGSGTNNRAVISRIRESRPSSGMLVVDERDTSLQARERYWEYHPRRGWRRILPASLQVPQEPIDDFAAFVLAERVLV